MSSQRVFVFAVGAVFTSLLFCLRAFLPLAAPALVLVLFRYPSGGVGDQALFFNLPVILGLGLLLFGVVADFCFELWRWDRARVEEKRLVEHIVSHPSHVLEKVLCLDRFVRACLVSPRLDLFFLPIWLVAAVAVNVDLAVALSLGVAVGFGVWVVLSLWLRAGAVRRERGIVSGGFLRLSAEHARAHSLGLLSPFLSRIGSRQERSRSLERGLVLFSAIGTGVVRVSAACTLVLLLVYGSALVQRSEADFAEVAAFLLFLRSIFWVLERNTEFFVFHSASPRLLSGLRFERLRGEVGEQERASEVALQVPQLEVLAGGKEILQVRGLSLEGGQVFGLQGEGGTGKSAFLQCLAGLGGYRGAIYRFGRLQPNTFSLREGIGYVPDEALLLSGSVAENVSGFAALPDERRVVEALEQVGAERHKDLLVGLSTRSGLFDQTLPQSLKAQILLAAALYRSPNLLLCDSALKHLDGAGRAAFARVVARIKQQGGTVILLAPLLSALYDGLLVCKNGELTRHRIAAAAKPSESGRDAVAH